MHQQDSFTGSFESSRSHQHVKYLQPSKTGKASESPILWGDGQEGHLQILLPPAWGGFRRKSSDLRLPNEEVTSTSRPTSPAWVLGTGTRAPGTREGPSVR